jgi:hypothetical protein
MYPRCTPFIRPHPSQKSSVNFLSPSPSSAQHASHLDDSIARSLDGSVAGQESDWGGMLQRRTSPVSLGDRCNVTGRR